MVMQACKHSTDEVNTEAPEAPWPASLDSFTSPRSVRDWESLLQKK